MRSILSVIVAAITAMALSVPAQAASAVDTEGHWRFAETSGPVRDSIHYPYTDDSTNERANNGYIGYNPGWGDDGAVKRNGAHVEFTGRANSIILVPDSHGDFNPGSRTMRWKVRLKLDSSVTRPSTFPDGASWNVIQKGRSGGIGGMWKMQIKNVDGKPYLHCQAVDGNDHTESAQVGPLKVGDIYYMTCVLDRTADEIKAIAENESRRTEIRADSALPSRFGSVNPRGGACPELAMVAMGNRPDCKNGASATAEDRFIGDFYQVKIDKPRNF